MSLAATINQSGTAAFDMFVANLTETAVGSGIKTLFKWQIAGVDRCTLTDGGNLLLGAHTAAGSSAAGVLSLSNGATAPTTSVDQVQFYSVDLSAGNATVGLFTETAVAVDVVLASTHTLTWKINGTNYKLLLST
jgi:hypothetical protein